MEVGDVRAHRLDHFTAFLDVVGVVAVRVQADVGYGGTNHFFTRIQHSNATATSGQFAGYFRIKHQSPGIGRCGVTQNLLNAAFVVAITVGAPQVRQGELAARVHLFQIIHQVRVEVGHVRQLAVVQRYERLGRNLLGYVVVGGHHQVITGTARQQGRFQHLVAVIYVVDNLDAGFFGELRQGVLGDVVRPVVDTHFLGCNNRRGTQRHSNSSGKRLWLTQLQHWMVSLTEKGWIQSVQDTRGSGGIRAIFNTMWGCALHKFHWRDRGLCVRTETWRGGDLYLVFTLVDGHGGVSWPL